MFVVIIIICILVGQNSCTRVLELLICAIHSKHGRGIYCAECAYFDFAFFSFTNP